MPPNLKTAILEFVANEFKLDPGTVTPDLNFQTDLNLTPPQLVDLLDRLQESLDFTLPEDKAATIASIEDLFTALDPEPDTLSLP